MPQGSRTGKPAVKQRAATLLDALSGDLPTEEPDLTTDPAAVEVGHGGSCVDGRGTGRGSAGNVKLLKLYRMTDCDSLQRSFFAL